MTEKRDHGGGLDAAIATYGGTRSDWLDLSTGINPLPYPVGDIGAETWTALPDSGAMWRLSKAARAFWHIPDTTELVIAGGASALIAQMPSVWSGSIVTIPKPTYNEHAAAFEAQGWVVQSEGRADVHVLVHPNNPDGRPWQVTHHPCPTIIDESFCDVTPQDSHVGRAAELDCVILKSFGKFWGLAGLRLGFAICPPDVARKLRDRLGPWAVSGPALEIGARALEDVAWADAARERLAEDAMRLDKVVGLPVVGGTDLFRLYEVADAAAAQDHLATAHVWSRIFPYSKTWLRLGLPHPDQWDQLGAAVDGLR